MVMEVLLRIVLTIYPVISRGLIAVKPPID